MAAPAKDITIGIEPVQVGSGDPSPTNVRPISGWTGANVTRTGKNLVDVDTVTRSSSGFVIGNSSGESIDSAHGEFSSGKYALSFTLTNGTVPCAAQFKLFNESGITVGDSTVSISANGRIDIPITASGSFTKWMLYCNSSSGGTFSEFMFEKGESASNYEPFGETYSITFPSEAGTVYDGTLDVTTGVLTVTMAEVDLGTLTWTTTITNCFYANVGNPPFKASYTTGMICSNYPNDGYGNAGVGFYGADKTLRYSFTGSSSYNEVYIKDTAYSDAATFKSAMSGVQLVYELATPQTYQLTPTEVDLLLGDNNVWADTGDSTVTYRADTKLYIQKINAPTDDDMIADAQIASGKYFIVDNNLYKSTTTIPAGDTINPGSNCILTNLADALNALNT